MHKICIITAIICLGDIIVGLIATLNALKCIYFNLILQEKAQFYDLKMYM